MRTLQEIYDFCRSDTTYRTYYKAPGLLGSGAIQYRYYHADLGNGHTRCGTYLFSQSRTQLLRFLGNDMTYFYFHMDIYSGEILSNTICSVPSVYVVVQVDGGGVRVSIAHPLNRAFDNRQIVFTARSHRPFTLEGLRDEAITHLRKHVLLAPGRYLNLQLKHCVPKDEFVEWYKNHKSMLQKEADFNHHMMLLRWRRNNPVNL